MALSSTGPNARDVARLAGVSTASVSLVVNGKAAGRLRPEIRTRVEAAIAQLGYRPQRRAQELSLGVNRTVGIIVPDIANPFFGYLLAGLAEAIGNDYELSLTVPSNGHQYGAEDVKHALRNAPGVLLLASPSRGLVESLEPDQRVVLIDAPAAGPGWNALDWDLGPGCADLAGHLYMTGHERIAYLGLARRHDVLTLQYRRDALDGELASHGASIVADLLIPDTSATEAAEAVQKEIGRLVSMGVTALVLEDDLYTLGVFAALHAAGIVVPTQMSVAAFNNTQISRLTMPSVTAVELDARAMGRLAADAARDVAAGRQDEPLTTTLPCALITRDSTTPPPPHQ